MRVDHLGVNRVTDFTLLVTVVFSNDSQPFLVKRDVFVAADSLESPLITVYIEGFLPGNISLSFTSVNIFGESAATPNSTAVVAEPSECHYSISSL